MAALRSNYKIALYMCEGFDLDVVQKVLLIRDVKGNTAMDIAEKNGDSWMVELFEKKLPKGHRNWKNKKLTSKDQSESLFCDPDIYRSEIQI